MRNLILFLLIYFIFVFRCIVCKDGWPQTIQFFRAHFGIEPPMGKKVRQFHLFSIFISNGISADNHLTLYIHFDLKIFVFAEPRDACQDLSNAGNLTSQHVLLVARGTCTFGTKAKNANKTNASAIIIINNEPGQVAARTNCNFKYFFALPQCIPPHIYTYTARSYIYDYNIM